jgi:hypothetical protein
MKHGGELDRVPSFRLEIGETRTWAQLDYKLGLIREALRTREHDGEIFIMDAGRIESLLSDEPLGVWEIIIPSIEEVANAE